MFAAVAAGNPLQLSEQVPNSNGLQHTIILSSTKPKQYSHITLFLLPNVTFPPDYVATVYFKLSPSEDFRLFGYLAAEKPSAIFKVKLSRAGIRKPQSSNVDGIGEIDMDDDDLADSTDNNISQLLIGISIEPRLQGLAKVEEQRKINSEANPGAVVLSSAGRNHAAGILSGSNITTAGQLARAYPALTQELAAKIVQHAYNYLSGFLDGQGNVSMKRFDTWWNKFKTRLSNDATFLDEVTND
ncbi:Opi10p SCDLUD_000499 [Saccharomycodes ludwigii]|uniref:Opi10p n=1 Tax=Saccharomycodes ludwigii TaxID=36035 RepID=UPI001E89D1DF|nr:hypothetical protein SCDLUD_000499 [Saccharomycodes ludwigii]KAH3902904.1 hypothetical protein SCDLUD_000499 [Saccharomycodes ludwigii]